MSFRFGLVGVLAVVTHFHACTPGGSARPADAPPAAPHPEQPTTTSAETQQASEGPEPEQPPRPEDPCESAIRTLVRELAQDRFSDADTLHLEGAPGVPLSTGADRFAPGFEYRIGRTVFDDEGEPFRVEWLGLVSVNPRSNDAYMMEDPSDPQFAHVGRLHEGLLAECRESWERPGRTCVEEWSHQLSQLLAARHPESKEWSVEGSWAADFLPEQELHWSVLASIYLTATGKAGPPVQAEVNTVEGTLFAEGEEAELSHAALQATALACGDVRWPSGPENGHHTQPAKVRQEQPKVEPPVDAETQRKVNLDLTTCAGSIRRCYADALERKDDTAGKVTLVFQVTSSGDVTNITPRGGTTGDPAIEACMAERACGMFPALRGNGGRVTATWTLEPGS